MSNLALIPLIGLLGAFCNWFLAGGGIESALLNNKSVAGLKVVSALIYGALAWWLSSHLIVGALLFLGMWVGRMPALGGYINAILGRDPEHSKLWGFGRMTLRGAIWGVLLALCMAITQFWVEVPHPFMFGYLCICMSSLQGSIYTNLALAHVNGWEGNKIFNFWTVSEMLSGFLLWLPIVIIKA